MKIWIYLNGQQEGPYTLEELADKPIDENTKVWFEGLPKWYPAGALAELRPLFTSEAEEYNVSDVSANTDLSDRTDVSNSAEISETKEASPRKLAPGQPFYGDRRLRPDKPCPPTYIGWSVAVTLLLTSPVSLAALVASIIVGTSYNKGNLDRSRKASEVAVWLIMASFALGLVPVVLFSMMLGS